MSENKFEWDEKTILEFVAKTIHDRLEWALIHDACAAPVPIQIALKEFVESKSPSPVVERDFEILEFRSTDRRDKEGWTKSEDGLFRKEYYTTFEEKDLIAHKYFAIHSVRRLSDKEVFVVGEEVIFDNYMDLKIASFKIIEKYIGVYTNSRQIALSIPISLNALSHVLKPVKKVLFTSFDGVTIYAGDDVFLLTEISWIIKKVAAPYDPFYGVRSQFKYFSTKEKAEEFVTMNRPVLSVQEIMDLPNTGFVEHLKKLAKEKINH